MAYLLDANVFIQAKNLHYGFDFCPAFWDWIEQENAGGRVLSIDRVRDELIGGDDELAAWAAARAGFFVEADPAIIASLQAVSRWANGASYEPAAIAIFLQVAAHPSRRSRSRTPASPSASAASRPTRCSAENAPGSSWARVPPDHAPRRDRPASMRCSSIH